jgi:hypothetical protein
MGMQTSQSLVHVYRLKGVMATEFSVCLYSRYTHSSILLYRFRDLDGEQTLDGRRDMRKKWTNCKLYMMNHRVDRFALRMEKNREDMLISNRLNS